MARALDEMVIEGIRTTIPLYRKVFKHPRFLSGRYNVGWLEKYLEQNGGGEETPEGGDNG